MTTPKDEQRMLYRSTLSDHYICSQHLLSLLLTKRLFAVLKLEQKQHDGHRKVKTPTAKMVY